MAAQVDELPVPTTTRSDGPVPATAVTGSDDTSATKPPAAAVRLKPEQIKHHVTDAMLVDILAKLTLVYSRPESKTAPFRIIHTDDSGNIIVIGKESGTILKTFPSEQRSIQRLLVWENSTKQQIISAGSDLSIRIFDFSGKQLRKAENCHTGRISTMIVSDDEAYEDAIIVTGGRDCAVKAWGVKTGKLKFEMKGHAASIVSLCFTVGIGEIDMIVSICQMGEIRLWSKRNGNLLRTIRTKL